MNGIHIGQIDTAAVYSPRQLANALGTGPQTIYRAIRGKALRAAVVNTRGDLRITGAWALDFLERAAGGPDALSGAGVTASSPTP